MTYVPVPLRRLIRDRARERCEYCLLPDAVGFYPHEIDHVVAGTTVISARFEKFS